MLRLLPISLVSCGLFLAGCDSSSTTSTTTTTTGPSVPVQKDGAAWTQFTSPDGKFSVSFPGEPQKLTGSEGETTYVVELEKGGGYTVMFSEIDEIKPEEFEARLAKIRDDVVENQKLLQDAPAKVGDVPARDFAYVDADKDAQFYRVFIVGTRLYQLMTVSEEGKFSSLKADRQKFVDSFKLAE